MPFVYVSANSDNGLTIIDVTDPENPAFKGSIQGTGSPNFLSGAFGVFVVGNFAYVSSTSDDALSIFDISDSENPILQGSIQGSGSPNFLNFAREVFVVGNFAYVVSQADNALSIFDISDPTAPTLEGSIQGSGAPNFLNGAYSVHVVGDFAYIACNQEDALTIIDVSTPASPTFKGSIQGSGAPNFLNGAQGVFVLDSFAYVASNQEPGLTIIDVSDPANPAFEGSIQGSGSPNFLLGAEGIHVVGNFAYVACSGEDALTIIDVSTPATPTFEGSIQGTGSPNFLNGAFGVKKVGNFAYVSCVVDSALTIIDVSDPANPAFEGSIQGTGSPNFLSGATKVALVLADFDAFEVAVDWQNNGNFTDAIDDITADTRMAQGFSLAWIRGADKELEAAATGTLVFAVNNGDSKYSPENTGSDLSPNVVPYRPVRLRRRHLGVTYTVFTGKIEKYVPHPAPEQQTVDIFCVDGMDQLERRIIEAPSGGAQTDVKLGDDPGPVETTLDAAAWPVADRSLDGGVDTLDVWWAHKESALAALRKLAKAEASLMYVDGDGKFVYEDRHHRLGDGGGGATDHLTSQATFSNTMSDMGYEFSARSIRNIINARGEKLTPGTQAYVWETQDTPSLPATNGATLEIWADLPNPVTGLVVPVANTDWKANTASDGTGDDETANVGIAGVKYGQAMKMILTNNTSPAKKVFIIPGTSDPEHTLRIQAQEWESNPVFTSVEDSTSKTAYGERALDIDIPFKGNFNDIQSFAEYLLARKKDAQPDFIRMTVVNGTDALWTQILARQISDRITVTEDDLGISSQDYFINKMQHRVTDGGKLHTVVWSLARADEEVFWVLGKAGFSELGQTTVLVF